MLEILDSIFDVFDDVVDYIGDSIIKGVETVKIYSLATVIFVRLLWDDIREKLS